MPRDMKAVKRELLDTLNDMFRWELHEMLYRVETESDLLLEAHQANVEKNEAMREQFDVVFAQFCADFRDDRDVQAMIVLRAEHEKLKNRFMRALNLLEQ